MPIQPVVDPAEARRAAERALGLVPAAGATEVAGVVAGGLSALHGLTSGAAIPFSRWRPRGA